MNSEENLKIIITPNDFKIDTIESKLNKNEKKLYDFYKINKYKLAYEISFDKNENYHISIMYLKYLTNVFFDKVIKDPNLNFSKLKNDIEFTEEEILNIIDNTPYILGKDYVDIKWLNNYFNQLNEIFYSEINEFDGTVSEYFNVRNKNLIIPSRIYFHLVENTKTNDYPFAFLATYTAFNNKKLVYYPLKFALQEFKNDKSKLKKLISSIMNVSKHSNFIKKIVESGEIFYPLNFNEEDAYQFLKELNIYEESGIICRIPNWWTTRKKTSKILIDLDDKLDEGTGMMTASNILKIVPNLMYNGVKISKEEIENLLCQNEGLANIKGKWIENNHEKLKELLDKYNYYSKDGTSLSEILQIMSGIKENATNENIFIEFTRKDWLSNFINKKFSQITPDSVNDNFVGTLRPYQLEAFKWLYGMNQLSFGVCLADDMGLGKTIEFLSFLSKYKSESGKNVLLIVPASLIENWKHEINKFTTDIDYFVLRGTKNVINGKVQAFLTITTYQTASKSEYLNSIDWDMIVLDEAQAIKNYDTLTTKKIKSLTSRMRIALTGTPIENNLLNLWSIYDFINPGLLGTRKQFKNFSKTLENNLENFQNLKMIIEPFTLRRLKTDKKIINDLPEKIENDIIINLTKEQIVLYKNCVKELEKNISKSKSEFEAKGKVLTTILSLKQICNHPSQYLGNQEFNVNESGKFMELKHICENIYEKREKVLIFTQFKEIIPALNNLLESIFKKCGCCIDGDTSLLKRDKYVNDFQTGEIPYMILSVKTGGVGLNLTAAQNVIHFDRWWNPAVENQATDRAYRIGQNKNVSVYKFISANTIEEIINKMLNVKQGLADKYINSIGDNILNKLSSDELLKTLNYRGDDEIE